MCVEPQAAGKGVALVDACAAGGELRYEGDENRVRQVLVNLLSNAIKFSDPGGRVTLECAQREDERAAEHKKGSAHSQWVLFRVRDTGPGIPVEKAQTIFEPFVQAETGSRHTQDGSGLGLAISRRLARLMGGDVTLERPGEGTGGGGAIFTLRLPAAASTHE